jgi:glycosyltransferase involved in cell wall biosynthesis
VTLQLLFLAERYPPDIAGGGELSASLVAQAVNALPDVQVRVLTQGDGREGEVEGVPVSYSIPRAPKSLPDDITRAELLTVRMAPLVAKALREADLVHSVSPRAIPAAVAGAKLARKPATAVMNDTWATCFTHSHVRRGEYCPICIPDGLKECLEDIGGNVAASPIIWRQFKRRMKAVSRLSGIVAVSPGIEGLLRQHKLSIPIAMIPQPMDLAAWDAVREVEAQPGLVVFMGRMAPGKGVMESLEAFARAAEGRPEARLILAGDGPMLDEVRKKTETLGISNRVELPGWVPAEEVPRTLAKAQVVMAPFMRVEAFGRVAMETAAAARPVVTTNLWGPVDLIHGEPGAGKVVKWYDTGEWAEALGELLDDPGGSVEMGREARRRLENLYGPDGVGSRYLEFFEGVLR